MMPEPTLAPYSASVAQATNGEKTTNGGPKPPSGHHDASLPSERLDLRRFGLDDSFTTSYPTKSLEFLRRLNAASDEKQGTQGLPRPLRARTMLKIVVVGAGLGGLSAAVALARSGHSVEVLEQAPALGEVSALIIHILDAVSNGRVAGRRWYPDTAELGQAPPAVGRLQVFGEEGSSA